MSMSTPAQRSTCACLLLTTTTTSLLSSALATSLFPDHERTVYILAFWLFGFWLLMMMAFKTWAVVTFPRMDSRGWMDGWMEQGAIDLGRLGQVFFWTFGRRGGGRGGGFLNTFCLVA